MGPVASDTPSSRHTPNASMKSIIFAALLAFAVARPENSAEHIAIVRDVRVEPTADGAYSFDMETANGIFRSESGAGVGPEGAVVQQGTVKFNHPDGSPFELSFVADGEGYKPDSAALPVAPAFPHPIPQFVLDQIAFAASQAAAAASESTEE